MASLTPRKLVYNFQDSCKLCLKEFETFKSGHVKQISRSEVDTVKYIKLQSNLSFITNHRSWIHSLVRYLR